VSKTYQITILNWNKHNPRKDVKRPSWFSFDNRMIEDEDFFGFNHGEFKAWIYMLSRASQKQIDTLKLNSEHAQKVCNISPEDFDSAVQKLASEDLKLIEVHTDVTSTLRARDVDVRSAEGDISATDKTDKTDITLQTDKTGAPPREKLPFDPEPPPQPSENPIYIFIKALKEGKLQFSDATKISILEKIYHDEHPLKTEGGARDTIVKLSEKIKSIEELADFYLAELAYKNFCKRGKIQKIYSFETFSGLWREWVPKDARRGA
jgi:hypothetical protein